MFPKEHLISFSNEVGFEVCIEDDVLRAVGVPCLLANRSLGTCTIEKSFDTHNEIPTDRIGGAVHAVRIVVDKECDGLVYNVDGTPIGATIDSDGKKWSCISIHKGESEFPQRDSNVYELMHRYVKQILGARCSADSNAGDSGNKYSRLTRPFKIPNTFEARTVIGSIQDRVRDQKVAILGLGGTGSFVLDCIAKTPVKDIHILDFDTLKFHNLMRAPGAPSTNEIELVRDGGLLKVDYYLAKYFPFRENIFAHSATGTDPAILAEFLRMSQIDFVFVCIDQSTSATVPVRQDSVYNAISDSKIPFIDSGVCLTIDDNRINGAITTSFYAAGCQLWKNAIPNSKIENEIPVYSNVQLPEVNALAASLAVMEWRRRTEQYRSESTSFLHKFRIEKPNILWPFD